MQAPVLSGPQYLREGLKLVLSPNLRLFVLLPLAVNLLLFGGLIDLLRRPPVRPVARCPDAHAA